MNLKDLHFSNPFYGDIPMVSGLMTHIREAAVFGASGAIGSAFVDALLSIDTIREIQAFSRTPVIFSDDRVVTHILDKWDEASIQKALTEVEPSLDFAVIATGILHDDTCRPEKTFKVLDIDCLQHLFQINTVLPAMIIKYCLPLLRKNEPAVIAALSARVGSIGDNRLGGWHSYRTSKAALNMLIRCFAIETAMKSREHMIVGLHPGTVDSPLSRPFQQRLKPGQLQSPDDAVKKMIQVIDSLTPEQSGTCIDYNGLTIPP